MYRHGIKSSLLPVIRIRKAMIFHTKTFIRRTALVGSRLEIRDGSFNNLGLPLQVLTLRV